MELLNRYLQAVRFWLPKGQQEDIAVELQEDLQSRIEEREAELGHALDEAQMAQLLRECGRPVLVASRYLPQQQLIGPVLFPIYLFVLKVVALCYVTPWLIVMVSLLAFDPAYRHGDSLGLALLGTLGSSWSLALTLFAVTTITFAVLERAQARSGFMAKWDPQKLPPVRDARQIKRSQSIAEIVVNLLLATWWMDGWGSAMVLAISHIQIRTTPVWQEIVVALVASAAANVALAVANLARPAWSRTRVLVRLGLDLAGAGIFLWFLQAQVLSAVIAPGVTTAQAEQFVRAEHAVQAQGFPLMVIACVLVVAISNGWRLARCWPLRSTALYGEPTQA